MGTHPVSSPLPWRYRPGASPTSIPLWPTLDGSPAAGVGGAGGRGAGGGGWQRPLVATTENLRTSHAPSCAPTHPWQDLYSCLHRQLLLPLLYVPARALPTPAFTWEIPLLLLPYSLPFPLSSCLHSICKESSDSVVCCKQAMTRALRSSHSLAQGPEPRSEPVNGVLCLAFFPFTRTSSSFAGVLAFLTQ